MSLAAPQKEQHAVELHLLYIDGVGQQKRSPQSKPMNVQQNNKERVGSLSQQRTTHDSEKIPVEKTTS